LFPLYLTFKQLAHDPTSPKIREEEEEEKVARERGEEIKLSL
jgi:hypothetical protein